VNKIKTWFRGLSMTGKVTTVAVASLLSYGMVAGAVSPPATTPTSSSSSSTSQSKAETAAPKVEVKTVTTTDAIPFTSSTVEDSSLASGTTQTRTAGVDGVMTHTVKVTYTDGVETSRSEPVDTVTTQPVNEVKAIGTYVAPVHTSTATDCPNGTYVNSAGNTVCSPYSSSSAPSGATAQCGDGTYSFSQSRSGTCSHHGGVSVWL